VYWKERGSSTAPLLRRALSRQGGRPDIISHSSTPNCEQEMLEVTSITSMDNISHSRTLNRKHMCGNGAGSWSHMDGHHLPQQHPKLKADVCLDPGTQVSCV
jgi:hypothetical protein